MTWTPPKTYLLRQTPNAAWLNEQIRDNLNELVCDNSWTAPTLTNSWVNYGAPYQVAQYRRQGGCVYLRGLIRSGTVATPAFTLPSGYRPSVTICRIVMANLNYGRLDISSSGTVVPTVNTDNAWWSLCCSFPVEQ